jgi:hypothetical protein
MHRRTVHRGIAALALIAVLALPGAQPAAAADLNFLDRLASLWSAVTDREPAASLWDTLTGWFGTEKATSLSDTPDRGAGIDPNGNSLTAAPTDPAASSPNG